MSEPSDWTAPESGRQPDPNRPSDQPSGQPPYQPPYQSQPPYQPYQPPPGAPVPPHSRPKPGVIPLRPLGVGEILDGAISYIRANPVATLGLSAVVITVTTLIQLVVQQWLLGDLLASVDDSSSSTEALAALGPALSGTLLSALITLVATIVLSGLLIVVLSQAVLGRTMTIGDAWAVTRSRVAGLIGLSLLTTLVIVVVAVVPVLIFTFLAIGADSPGIIFIGFLIAIVLAAFIGVSLQLSTPAYVLEAIPALTSLRRSWELVRPNWWRVFGILLLGGLITTIVSGVISVPFTFIGTGLAGPIDPENLTATADALTNPSFGSQLVTAIGTIVAGTITSPFSAGITGLLYIDQRMRREALDLELLGIAQRLGGDVEFPPPPAK